MPYRRLPNTDSARIRSLECVVNKDDMFLAPEPVLSYHIVTEANVFLPRFKSAYTIYHQYLDIQVKDNATYQVKLSNARMYIYHFIRISMQNKIRHARQKTGQHYKINIMLPQHR